jgi:hypothetical protein
MTKQQMAVVPQVPGSRSKFTLLLDGGDAVAFDELALALRRRCGRRVDKAEIVRAMIEISAENPAVLSALAGVLDRRAGVS